MRRFFICLFTVFIYIICVACHYETELEGIWITTYTVDGNGKRDFETVYEKSIWDFEKNKLTLINLNARIHEKEVREKTITFKLEEGYLIGEDLYYSDTLEFKRITQDSLIIRPLGFEDWDILKKIKQANSPEHLELVNQAYNFKSQHYSDTLEFANDSLVIFYQKYNEFPYTGIWGTYRYKGLLFLTLNDFLPECFLIKTIDDGNLQLEGFYVNNRQVELEALGQNKDSLPLLGQWKGIQIKPDSASMPPIPPYLEGADTQEYLTFDKDTLEIQRYKSKVKMNWATSLTHQLIYLRERKNTSKIWKIRSLSETEMVVERKDRFCPECETELIAFKKVINN